MLDKLDVAPGTKSAVTAFVTALFNLLSAFGIITLSPELVNVVNVVLVSLFGAFFALKANRLIKAVGK